MKKVYWIVSVGIYMWECDDDTAESPIPLMRSPEGRYGTLKEAIVREVELRLLGHRDVKIERWKEDA